MESIRKIILIVKTMQRTSMIAIAVLAALMLAPMQRVYAADETVEGFISDTMCGNNHMRMITQLKVLGKTAAECIAMCIRQNASYALVIGDKVYALAGNPRW